MRSDEEWFHDDTMSKSLGQQQEWSQRLGSMMQGHDGFMMVHGSLWSDSLTFPK